VALPLWVGLTTFPGCGGRLPRLGQDSECWGWAGREGLLWVLGPQEESLPACEVSPATDGAGSLTLANFTVAWNGPAVKLPGG